MLSQSFFPDLSAPLLCRSYSHNLNDPVHVIGHDHKAVHINSSKMKRNRGPAFTSDAHKRGEFNACLAHSAKDAPLVMRADCHEVEAGSRIISVLQTSGWRHCLARGRFQITLAQHAAPLQRSCLL